MPPNSSFEALEQRVRDLETELIKLRGMEKVLGESREALAAFFSSSSDIICTIDSLSATFLKINPAFTQHLGYSESELLKRPFLDVVHPDDVEQTRKVISGGKAGCFESRFRCGDGAIRLLAWQWLPMPEHGIVYGIAHEKIRRQVRKEDDWQRETLVRSVIDNLPIGIAVHSTVPPFVAEYVNDNYFKYYRISKDAISSPDDFWNTVYECPQFREMLRQSVTEDILSGDPSRMVWEDIPITRKGEETTYITSRSTPLPEQGLMVATVWDVTTRKLAEERLRKYERIVSTSQDFLIMINTDFIYEAVNESYLNSMNMAQEEIVGRAVADVMGNALFQEIFKPRLNRAFTGKTVKGEHVFVPEGAGPRIMEDTIFPMFDGDGRVEGAVVHVRDITEKKKLEAQLAQSQKMESIGRIAGGVAHDLNNLLTPILAYGEMLSNDLRPDDPRQAKLSQIVQAGLRARDLVRQLLAFSRKQALEYKPLNMNKVVTDFEKLLRRTIPEDIHIDIVLGADIQEVMADVGQIEQVVMNLVVNAADAMPDGGHLTIKTSMVDLDAADTEVNQVVTSGHYVMLTVSDTGHGMDSETRQHLFEPFFSTKGEQGTGLGLATVYGIVKQHNGNILVYSEPDQGTTFKVYLPVIKQRVGTVKQIDENIPTDLEGSETILLVEDNEMVRELGYAILARQGYSVLVAPNGQEALELMASHGSPIDLLLTDLIMPGMNGKELYDKACVKQPGLRVLYMSGYTDNVIVHKGILDDGVQLIQKPFTIDGLAMDVRKALLK